MRWTPQINDRELRIRWGCAAFLGGVVLLTIAFWAVIIMWLLGAFK